MGSNISNSKMKVLKLFIVVISFFSINKSLEINHELFNNFLNYFNLNYGIIFHCESLDNSVWSKVVENEFKYFSFYDISSSEFKLSEIRTVMRVIYHQLGILFDITCNETLEVFYELSRFHFFNASYNWLMVTGNYTTSMELLHAQNINLDAEITLAIIDDQTNNVQLYDIYNPGSTNKGKFIVNKKGSWNVNDKLVITLKGSKFDRRANLNGIFINAGVVASGVGRNQTLQEYLGSKENHQLLNSFNCYYKYF